MLGSGKGFKNVECLGAAPRRNRSPIAQLNIFEDSTFTPNCVFPPGNPFQESGALVDSISFQPGVRLNLAVTSTNTLLLSWPTNAVDSFPFVLHQSPDFSTNSWVAVTNVPTYASGTNSVTLPLPSFPTYYRLKIVP